MYSSKCSGCVILSNVLPRVPLQEQEHPGQEAVFGNELLNQTLHKPPDSASGPCPSSCIPLVPVTSARKPSLFLVCGWNYRGLSANPQTQPHLNFTPSHPSPPSLHSSRLTSPNAPLNTLQPSPPSLHRWLLHNEQHLVLISPQKPKQHEERRGREGWWWGGRREDGRKTFTESSMRKRRWVKKEWGVAFLSFFDGPGVRKCVACWPLFFFCCCI